MVSRYINIYQLFSKIDIFESYGQLATQSKIFEAAPDTTQK